MRKILLLFLTFATLVLSEASRFPDNLGPIKIKNDVCVIVWGFSRSARFTTRSFDRMLLQPLRAAKLTYTVRFHTWLPSNLIYFNSRTHEKNHTLDAQDYLSVPANLIAAEAEPTNFNVTPYLVNGDAWGTKDTAYNVLLSLISLQRTLGMWHSRECGYVVYTRPDLLFKDKFNTSWLPFADQHLLVPNNNQWPINDRFAVGNPVLMRAYANRFAHALTFASREMFHSERLLHYVTLLNRWSLKKIRFGMSRVRSDGIVDWRDRNQPAEEFDL